MGSVLKKSFVIAASLLPTLLSPAAASAHEVYVLNPQQIAYGLSTPPFSLWNVLLENLHQFMLWGFIAVFSVLVIFFISILRPLERLLDPWLARGKKYAPLVARVTIGISFLAAAYYQASYGSELPLSATFGSWTPYVTLILMLIGVLIIVGYFTRSAAFVALVLFSVAVYYHGSYMFTYTNYLGEILVLLLLGAHHGSVDGADNRFRTPQHIFDAVARKMAPYSFVLLRVCFGVSLLYAALYAKFFHDYLALQVAQLPLAGHAYGIAYYFHLSPEFMVLGAGIIEIVIGLFFLLGIEIRFTSLFLEFWLTLSLMYFGEVVWPHIILIGIPIAFILYGYDAYSIEGFFFKKGERQPVF